MTVPFLLEERLECPFLRKNMFTITIVMITMTVNNNNNSNNSNKRKEDMTNIYTILASQALNDRVLN